MVNARTNLCDRVTRRGCTDSLLRARSGRCAIRTYAAKHVLVSKILVAQVLDAEQILVVELLGNVPKVEHALVVVGRCGV